MRTSEARIPNVALQTGIGKSPALTEIAEPRTPNSELPLPLAFLLQADRNGPAMLFTRRRRVFGASPFWVRVGPLERSEKTRPRH